MRPSATNSCYDENPLTPCTDYDKANPPAGPCIEPRFATPKRLGLLFYTVTTERR